MAGEICDCELRDRAWDPNTGRCHTCGRRSWFRWFRFPEPPPEPPPDLDEGWAIAKSIAKSIAKQLRNTIGHELAAVRARVEVVEREVAELKRAAAKPDLSPLEEAGKIASDATAYKKPYWERKERPAIPLVNERQYREIVDEPRFQIWTSDDDVGRYEIKHEVHPVDEILHLVSDIHWRLCSDFGVERGEHERLTRAWHAKHGYPSPSPSRSVTRPYAPPLPFLFRFMTYEPDQG